MPVGVWREKLEYSVSVKPAVAASPERQEENHSSSCLSPEIIGKKVYIFFPYYLDTSYTVTNKQDVDRRKGMRKPFGIH